MCKYMISTKSAMIYINMLGKELLFYNLIYTCEITKTYNNLP